MNKNLRRIIVVSAFLALMLMNPFAVALSAERAEIFVTSPWLSVIARFIGGVNVVVKPIHYWNDEGVAVRRIQARRIPSDGVIIALDVPEAEALRLKGDQYPNLFLLYSKAPFDRERVDFQYSDPSVIPFIAQRMLTIFSRLDPGSYSYSQRRLSEFQTRLDSTVLVGRQLLRGSPVFDLSGGFSSLLSAAGCVILPEDGEKKERWSRGEDSDGLQREVEDVLKRKIPVIMDGGTPRAIRTALKGNKDVLILGRPAEDQDLLIFFHDQFLTLWNRLAPLRELEQPSR